MDYNNCDNCECNCHWNCPNGLRCSGLISSLKQLPGHGYSIGKHNYNKPTIVNYTANMATTIAGTHTHMLRGKEHSLIGRVEWHLIMCSSRTGSSQQCQLNKDNNNCAITRQSNRNRKQETERKRRRGKQAATIPCFPQYAINKFRVETAVRMEGRRCNFLGIFETNYQHNGWQIVGILCIESKHGIDTTYLGRSEPTIKRKQPLKFSHQTLSN